MPDKGEKPLKVALAGLGNVGAALYYLIDSGKYKTTALPDNVSFARPLEITSVYASDKTKKRSVLLGDLTIDLDIQAIPFVTQWQELLAGKPDVVVEATGNVAFAKELAIETLQAGIAFVTANKALMAEHGLELQRLAEKHHASLLMEASVAGGIPILHGLYSSGKKIKSITAILNGTTNFILDKMTGEAMPYEEALKEAQRLGFAESEPAFDVNGMDSRQKLILLSAIAFGKFVPEHLVECEGITTVTSAQIQMAKDNNYLFKLLGVAENAEPPRLHVRPYLVPSDSAFARAKGSENIIRIQFEDGTSLDYVGLGAGGIATAEAVLLDLACLTKENRKCHVFGRQAQEIEIMSSCAVPDVKIANDNLKYAVL